jgi:hypothetical protein
MRGATGKARIGNRRNTCRTCNDFAQASRRAMIQAVQARFPDECAAIRLEVELALYPAVMARFIQSYPAAAPPETEA